MNDRYIVMAMIRGQKFIWIFAEDTRGEALRSLGRFACDPEIDFTWLDAAQVSRKMRRASSSSATILS